ncbi:hypothetical protein AB0E64_02110 [Streptomyces caelestis]|uniref:Uncharacterized protein n=1 Tax=Streptomyces caelestis TaxID=36816 RepID=A0A7W9HAZ8_9ACTN|nr:hypothetical protein [Streptomyces caelestis]MBB5798639.1 hypothetical protein [Streptomyces caelestis]
MNAVASSIAEALEADDPYRSFAEIKRLLEQHIRQINPQIRTRSTGYYNHTHMPDLVMRWPHDDGLSDRYVYLRSTTDADELGFDVTRLARQDRPIVLALGALRPPFDARALDSLAIDQHTLVLDLAAFAELASGDSADVALRRLIANTVIEGGQGLFDERSVSRLARAMTTGAQAARRGDREATEDALAFASDTLPPPIARRLTAFLATMWRASGAPVAALERAPRYPQQLDESSLDYLLEGQEIPDGDFWNRIAREITLIDLLRHIRITGTDNLQHLMRAALSTWNARVCAVVPSSRGAARRGTAFPRWTKSEGVLSFDAPGFVLTLAQKVDHLTSSAAGVVYELPALDEVGKRLPLLGLSLKAITLVNGGGKVAYEGEVGALHGDRLRHLSESLGPGTLVRNLEALPPSGVPVRYNFSTRTASVKPPRGSVPLLELVNTSIRLFTDLSREEEERLIEVIPPGGRTLHAGIDHDMPGTESPAD